MTDKRTRARINAEVALNADARSEGAGALERLVDAARGIGLAICDLADAIREHADGDDEPGVPPEG